MLVGWEKCLGKPLPGLTSQPASCGPHSWARWRAQGWRRPRQEVRNTDPDPGVIPRSNERRAGGSQGNTPRIALSESRKYLATSAINSESRASCHRQTQSKVGVYGPFCPVEAPGGWQGLAVIFPAQIISPTLTRMGSGHLEGVGAGRKGMTLEMPSFQVS